MIGRWFRCPPPMPAPAADAERRIDRLHKVYAEVGNYDRHYSTVRATLTALVVTIGLGAAAEPVKSVFTEVSPICALGDPGWIVAHFEPYMPTLLLFGLAVAVSLYFQRLTSACGLIEREIERRVIELAGGVAPPRRRRLAGLDLTLLGFRHDLAAVHRVVPWLQVDAMTGLLLTGISGFAAFVVVANLQRCGFWTAWYWPLLWFLLPIAVVAGLLALLRWARR